MGATEIVTALVSPANKLIDTVSGAIGKAYEPRHRRKMADAKAYEIAKVGSAIRDNCDMPIEYNHDGTLQIDTSNYEELIKRTGLRLAFQEVKKQENIESVVDKAYELLENEIEGSNEPVDEGWMLRFINSVSDISDVDLQIMWSKILAGEIKNPNTYSLRTLETLKNISKSEAELFNKVSKIIVHDFVVNNTELMNKYGIIFSDILSLDDCGLINSSGLITSTITFHDGEIVLSNDNYVLRYNDANSDGNSKPEITLGVYVLTEAGKNILKIIDQQPDDDYFIELCRYIQSKYPSLSLTIHEVR